MGRNLNKIPIYNAFIHRTRYEDVYDVSIPEVFPEQVFEILGIENVIPAIHESCEIALGTEEFHLQIFTSPEDLEEISKYS